VDLSSALKEVLVTGRRILAALDRDEISGCHELIQIRQRQLETLHAALGTASPTERAACRDTWDHLVAADSELRERLVAARDSVGSELGRLRDRGTPGSPYQYTPPSCCDREA
jgi:hypothetical protein